MYRLIGSVQNYAWGKKGKDSLVAQLYSTSGASAFAIDADKPYAELWLGGHYSAPSKISENGNGTESLVDLNVWLQQDPLNRSGTESGHLPFLLKVLSIGQPLSIQAHPDKNLAQRLHAENPEVYRDPNHKPEIAVPLGPFEALCGFKPVIEIKHTLDAYNEIQSLISAELANELKTMDSNNSSVVKDVLKRAFTKLLTADKKDVKSQLDELVVRIASDKNKTSELLLHIHRDYPGDIGNFCALLLNYLQLDETKNAGLYMGPNEPHAYLHGDIIECMACSDNVVRAGLTPKLIDVATLSSMLTYNTGAPAVINGIKTSHDGVEISSFVPPVEEFKVEIIKLGSNSHAFESLKGASIILVLSGSGVASAQNQFTLERGFSFFITPGCTFTVSSHTNLVLCRALPNK